MKIILVATGAKGKNVVFVSDTLRAYSLEEAVWLAKEGKFENVYADINKTPEILATLYSMYKPPHAHPEANDRGLQIANEFYQLAQQWLQ